MLIFVSLLVLFMFEYNPIQSNPHFQITATLLSLRHHYPFFLFFSTKNFVLKQHGYTNFYFPPLFVVNLLQYFEKK